MVLPNGAEIFIFFDSFPHPFRNITGDAMMIRSTTEMIFGIDLIKPPKGAA
jgi:hypothetical protein